ncbi:MAG: fasciclin domain-containing protein [Ilumatobacteraceae bacterium]
MSDHLPPSDGTPGDPHVPEPDPAVPDLPPTEPTPIVVNPVSDPDVPPYVDEPYVEPYVEPTIVQPAVVPPVVVPPTIAGPVQPGVYVPVEEPLATERWYDNRAAVGTVIAVGLLGLFALIAWLIWWSGDDDESLATTSSSTTLEITEGTVLEVEPLPTVTTEVITTASSILVEPLPTVAPSTAPASTTTAPATTEAPATTAPVVVATTVPVTTTTTPATTTTTPAATTTTTVVPRVTVPSNTSTLLDTINASPDLSQLAAAVQRVGLADTLSGDQPITLFAPTDAAFDAFAATPAGAAVLADDAQLRDLLLGHAVSGSLDSAAVFAQVGYTTLADTVVQVDKAAMTVGGVTVIPGDYQTVNGYLHTLNGVIGG